MSLRGFPGGGYTQTIMPGRNPSPSAMPARPSPSGSAPAAPQNTYRGPDSTTYAYGNGRWGHTPQAPGEASPVQPRSQGTPYGAYAPQVNSNQPGQGQPTFGSGYLTPPSRGSSPGRPASSTSYGDPRGGLATQAPANRPPPFQVQAQTTWGQSNDPFAQRDAFVNQLNQQRMQRQIDFNSAGSPQGSPWLNYGQAAQQAGVFSPQSGDGLIDRLNRQYGQPEQPQVNYYPGSEPRTQTPVGQPFPPGRMPPPANMERMPTYGYPEASPQPFRRGGMNLSPSVGPPNMHGGLSAASERRLWLASRPYRY